jgi:hypothetical protein
MKCVVCGCEIPEKRLEILPGVNTCVKHSSASKLVGVPVNIGEGDHCYTDLMIMNQDQYQEFERLRVGRGKTNSSNTAEVNE